MQAWDIGAGWGRDGAPSPHKSEVLPRLGPPTSGANHGDRALGCLPLNCSRLLTVLLVMSLSRRGVETVEEPLRLRGVRSPGERHDGVRSLLEQVGVGPELMSRRPAALSGGQRQRVSLARALACEPALLVADEPVSALDEDARGEILGLLARLREQRKLALILIAHDLETVRAVCEKTAVIWRGRIVENGPTEEILEQPLHPYTRHLVAAAGMRNTPPPGATSALDELREVEPGHWAALP